MNYKIIQTGSKGNAVIVEDAILFDCGVPYKKLKGEKFLLVALTHCHSDHFNKKTITRLADEHPLLRWLVPYYLVDEILDCGVRKKQIDVHSHNGVTSFSYKNGKLTIEPIHLIHDVPNCGYRFAVNGETGLYATDTGSMDHVEAKNLDYYFIEVNYAEDDLKKRIADKEEKGEFIYEYRVADTHLSEEQAVRFISLNAREDSRVIYLHEHKEVTK